MPPVTHSNRPPSKHLFRVSDDDIGLFQSRWTSAAIERYLGSASNPFDEPTGRVHSGVRIVDCDPSYPNAPGFYSRQAIQGVKCLWVRSKDSSVHDRWSQFATALESGESDRVTEVIDEIREIDLDERVELFDVRFDDVTQMYEAADDGYVRQSLVRVADQLTPGIPTVMAVDNDDRSIGAGEADIRDQTDAICGFLLEALTDDDGRVRRSAKRGLQGVFRTYNALGDDETLEALVIELEEMAAEATGKQRKHLRETRADAEFSLRSGVARLVEGFEAEFDESPNLDT